MVKLLNGDKLQINSLTNQQFNKESKCAFQLIG